MKLILAHHYTIEPVSSLAPRGLQARCVLRKEDTEDNIRKGRWRKIIHIESVIQTSMISRNDFLYIFGHFDLRHVLEPNSAHRGLCADWLHRCLDGCLRPEGDTVARGSRGGQPLGSSLSILVAVRQRWKRRCKGWRQRTSFSSEMHFMSRAVMCLGSFKLGHLLGCHEAC